MNIYSLTDNGNGFFTPGAGSFYSNSEIGAASDLHFIPSGTFAKDLMYTNWSQGRVSIIDIDTSTGLPQGGGGSPTLTLFASGLGTGPWGLEFDPINNNLFISNFAGNPSDTIIQISGFPEGGPIPEPSTLLLLGSGLVGAGLARRARRRK